MMLERFVTGATVAKARAMYGKRIRPEDYRELIHRNSVAEAADYLKRNTHYSRVLSNIDTNTIHRGFLEELIRKDGMDKYEELCRFQHIDETPFYNYEIKQREVEQIVAAVMNLNSGVSDQYIGSLPVYLAKHASFDLMALAKAQTYKELLAVLARTPYRDIILDQMPDNNGHYNCTDIELKLRIFYLNWVRDSISQNFSKKEAELLHRVFKDQIDLINAANTFRLKAFARVGADFPEDGNLLPSYSRRKGKFHQSASQLQLMEAANPEEYLKRLETSYYGRQIKQFEEHITEENIEHALLTLRFKLAKQHFRASQSPAVSFFTIMYLFGVEQQNVINIIEGIRYQVPVSYIEKLLIH